MLSLRASFTASVGLVPFDSIVSYSAPSRGLLLSASVDILQELIVSLLVNYKYALK